VVGRKGVDALWALTAERARMVQREHDAWTRAGVDALDHLAGH